MSPEPLPSLPAPDFWRSLEERANTPEFARQLANEFPNGATVWSDQFDRRDFLRLMGASLALAGLSGCARPSGSKIVPYVSTPENAVPGVPRFYATAFPLEGFARGIVVEAHDGRPTKIEGNPAHPDSQGATDALTQASILSLYDPDRSRSPLRLGQPAPWADFEAEWQTRRAQLAAKRGRGLAVLLEPTTSPTLLRLPAELRANLPEARWYQDTPLASYTVDGLQAEYDLSAADVVLFLDSDLLVRHPAALRHARAFASRRRAGAHLSRCYAIEATPSLTGVQADFRLARSPARTRRILAQVDQLLRAEGAANSGLTQEETAFVASLVADLRQAGPRAVVVAGGEQDDDLRRWSRALNRRLGAVGKAVRYVPAVRSDHAPEVRGGVAHLAADVAAGEIDSLFVLGGNPGYTAGGPGPADGMLARIPWSAHLGSGADETGRACTWHLPESHYLEAWGDLRSFGGTATIQQPLIEPLGASRSAVELLQLVAHGTHADGYELVRATWSPVPGPAGFEARWNRWLVAGLVDDEARAPVPDREVPLDRALLPGAEPAVGLSLVILPDPTVGDGRWANNAWLQELPKPLTHLVWDNAVLLAPSQAEALGLAAGDCVEVASDDRRAEGPVWLMPGQAHTVVAVTLGYGRTAAGAVGNGRGFDAYPLRSAATKWRAEGVRLRRLGRTLALATTQHHFTMEGRDLVRVVSPEAERLPAAAKPTSLFPDWKRGTYAWGMAIDLSTCTGCNACVIACQAENNIPVVGKDQVLRGREMHWIRIDQYYEGDREKPQFVHQPVPCMHCENAPCELVCPVGATVHNSEGLNEMVYNRCVGTRYCSNNCPYKVRRFNFLDYRPAKSDLSNLQKNPDVTVRERGVMEKCSYCVQRINAARITAEKEDRSIRDGEIRTACEQACAAEAIVFGNIADPTSRVARRKREATSFSLLEALNTRPRTTYLAKIRQTGGGKHA